MGPNDEMELPPTASKFSYFFTLTPKQNKKKSILNFKNFAFSYKNYVRIIEQVLPDQLITQEDLSAVQILPDLVK